MIRLCIDPGHGFSNRRPGVYDPGAVSSGVTEADIVLQFALSGVWIAKQEFPGVFEITLTRDDDKDPDPVSLRDDKAEAMGADFLLSLHCNAYNGQTRGTETYYRDSQDREFGELAQAAALVAFRGPNRGMKDEKESQHKGGLAVFGFDGPAALCELEFIDHPGARELLLRRDSRLTFWRNLFGAMKGLPQ